MSSRGDHYYTSVGKSRRTPPGDTQGDVGFFHTYQGQGGRTVLPPLSAAFPTSHFPVPSTYPNQYSQPRSSQGRGGYNDTYNNQWPNAAAAAQPSSFPLYDTPYQAQPSYPPSGYPSRTSPAIPSELQGSRRLPPLNTTREERWQTASYPHAASQVPVMNNIRSPTAGYAANYPPYLTNQQSSYSYPAVPDSRNMPHSLTSMSHQTQHMRTGPPATDRMTSSRNETRSTSPSYGRNSSAVPTTYAQAPAAPPAEEPAIKKKRKRADAAQLRVLNDTYNRTAFPSTEERAELAKKLDMSARSVQIWFQNKRQSMRQTGRQTSTAVTSSSHHPFSMHSDTMLGRDDDSGMHASVGGYADGSIAMSMPGSNPSYMSRSPHDNSRSTTHTSSTMSSSHRRHRNPEEDHDSHKWSGGY